MKEKNENIFNQEFTGLTLVDAGLIAISKVFTEETLSKINFVGNGTYKSALVKALLGLGLNLSLKNKFVGYVSTALIIDALEDAVLFTKRNFTPNNEEFINGQVF